MKRWDLAKQRVLKLYADLEAREGKYRRNMNRYFNNGVRQDDLWTPNIWPMAYAAPAKNTDGVQTQFNLIKSNVDTIVSKISQTVVRPYFNPVNGNWETRKVTRSLQQNFDLWIDERHLYPEAVMALRDACVLDMGVAKLDHRTKEARYIPTWEYFVSPEEYHHKEITTVMHYRKFYPIRGIIKNTDNSYIKSQYEQNPWYSSDYWQLFDLDNGLMYEMFDGKEIGEPEKLDFERGANGLMRRPFVEIYYNKPMKGLYSTSLADDIYPIQCQIDQMVIRLDSAFRKGILSMVGVPRVNGRPAIKITDLENDVSALEYDVGPEGTPLQFWTPPAINPQYIAGLDMYIDRSSSLQGLNQMSVQGLKPADLESGRALETLDQVQSERHQVILSYYTHFLVSIVKAAIEVFPSNESILPPEYCRPKITWGQARREIAKMSIQFAPTSSLSKDPSTKLNQIQQMMQMKMIQPSDSPKFFEYPDMEKAYSLANAAGDYVDSVIEKAVDTGDVNYLPTIDLQVLHDRTLAELNILSSIDSEQEYVSNLKKLLKKVSSDLKRISDKAQATGPAAQAQMVQAGEQAKATGKAEGEVLGQTMGQLQAQKLVAQAQNQQGPANQIPAPQAGAA